MLFLHSLVVSSDWCGFISNCLHIFLHTVEVVKRLSEKIEVILNVSDKIVLNYLQVTTKVVIKSKCLFFRCYQEHLFVQVEVFIEIFIGYFF